MSYYDIKRDTKAVNAGGFFCQVCCVGKPSSEASSDPRYCLACFEFLMDEAAQLTAGKRPRWMPKRPRIDPIAAQKAIRVSEQGEQVGGAVQDALLATQDSTEPCDIITDEVRVGYEDGEVILSQERATPVARGRKRQELPEDRISELAARPCTCWTTSTERFEDGPP